MGKQKTATYFLSWYQVFIFSFLHHPFLASLTESHVHAAIELGSNGELAHLNSPFFKQIDTHIYINDTHRTCVKYTSNGKFVTLASYEELW